MERVFAGRKLWREQRLRVVDRNVADLRRVYWTGDVSTSQIHVVISF